ncbi:hypothetical protein CEUSTIGMA_g7627.t1 [Chlamydomonas eustigma]|uniref:Uncharacterized protein n=1 Tax=Chlamydomonas eustigma TaxID=1157962 RepID=A0A250XBC1_9CHLO|nr:hypothetical protein CEUSTIGMA_g7627.t1 [Chlamydomonas eustigma]|eukprot:GAX80189.1 hypothetical protein CEUSTIGMA_g7627.t1 [Chlamydomonas eustigma]
MWLSYFQVSPLASLCRVDLTASEFFKNDLGKFTPCFIDLAVLGTTHFIGLVLFVLHLKRSSSVSSTKYSLIRYARAIQYIQIIASVLCALTPLLELNAILGQAAADPEADGPAPHEYAAVALAIFSWSALAGLLGMELQGNYVPKARKAVRFAVTLMTSSELVKLRILVGLEPNQDYFLYLYLSYVGLQCVLTLLALCYWPSSASLDLTHEGVVSSNSFSGKGQYGALPSGVSSSEVGASLWSTLTFSWLTPLLKAGYKTAITKDQVPELPPSDKVNHVANNFDRYWRRELEREGPASLSRACWSTVSHLYIAALPFKLVNDASQFVGPVFLNMLLKVVADENAPAWKGYLYAGLMFLGTLTGLIADHQHFLRSTRAGLRLSAVLSATVQRKVLYLTPSARSHFSSGRVFSLVASDASSINSLCWNAFALLSSPLRIAVAVYLLYYQLGVSCFVAIACLLLMVPLNMTLMAWTSERLKAALTHSDERTKLEGELVGGIQIVKCSAWEGPFLQRILQARKRELAMLDNVNLLQALGLFIMYAVPSIVPVATFSVYLLLGNELSSAEAFTALALFNILRYPLFLLPQLLQQVTQAQVSVTRLQSFLEAEVVEETAPLSAAGPGETAVSISGDFCWDSEGAPSLVDLDLEVWTGQLVVVVGVTGSGKTSLLSAMLGQMQQVYGSHPCIKGKVAYVPQVPFIIQGSLRDNILFGLPYHAARYQHCIQCTGLDADLSALAGGDATELGDNGVNLSGGQRQCLSIARALYSNADVFLLDDPLSALDSKVGRKVFDQAIRRAMKKAGKTVILATNQLYFLQAADLVVNMSDGQVAEAGPFPTLMASGGQFANMMKEVQVEQEGHGLEMDATNAASTTASHISDGGQQAPPIFRLTSDEASARGAVGAEVMLSYISAMGGMFWFSLLFLGYLIVEALRIATTVWLSVWTGSTDSSEDGSPGTLSPMFYLCVYAAISGVQVIAQLGNIIHNSILCLAAAGRLHLGLLHSLLSAPMSFFHSTPVGRIVNRLTRDTADVDRQLANNLGMALRSFLQLLSIILLMGWVAPLALPPMVVIMLGFSLLFMYYQATVRQVKRLEMISRSPMLTCLTETITGCSTIRAFGCGHQLVDRFQKLVDVSMSNMHASNCLNRWLGVRLETLGALSTLLASVVAVEQRGGANNAGLVLSYAMQLTILMSITLRQSSTVENNLNSVERLCEYTKLPRESSEKSGHRRDAKQQEPPKGWPSQGEVEFKQVAMRYRPGLPLVLRGVSFKAAAKEKVGIVGRTGAGKSSMFGCLFRLIEVESGAISIDGFSISKIPLSKLRSSMALIPQVPVLFTGSIRLNLSPFGLHNDAELWNVLRRAHLAAVVEAWPAGLDTLLQEGGSPLSAGQKQLLALARAQLNPSRVLVLDEATANVDVETDAVIQRTMRTEFKDRTILAIAHRLHTIIDYDKVLVLDRGMVSEFSTPRALLAKPSSIFTSMVNDTGEATAKFLKGVAAGKVDLADSMSVVAEAGMEKLSTPAWGVVGSYGGMPSLLQQLVPAGVPEGQILQTLTAQLLERSQAVTRLVKDIARDISRSSYEEDSLMAAQGMIKGEAISSAPGLTTAQRSVLQAIDVLNQVQQYAEAAAATLKPKDRRHSEEHLHPTNLYQSLRLHLGRTSVNNQQARLARLAIQSMSLQPSGCSSPEKEDRLVWPQVASSLHASMPSSPARVSRPPQVMIGTSGSCDLDDDMAALRYKQREEMISLMRNLSSKPISCALPGGDAAQSIRVSHDQVNPESLPVGMASPRQVADMARIAAGYVRAKSVLSKPFKHAS